MARSFLAQYDGYCAECGGGIVADVDEIVMTDDGAVHEDCAPDDEPKLATFPI